MSDESHPCPVCTRPAKVYDFGAGEVASACECRLCGDFRITLGAAVELAKYPNDRPYLSAATRQASEQKEPLRLHNDNWRDYAEQHRSSTVATRIDKLLHAIAHKCDRPGEDIQLAMSLDYPLADAGSDRELSAYVEHLKTRGLIEADFADISSVTMTVTPTIAGWQQVEPRARVGGIPGRCFVAMSFDDDLDKAYFEGIKAGIVECGHAPVRMKELLHNEDITARLLAEIRGAEYTVADFTKHKNGVYYEAAFARGLGRQVIMTCRDTDFGGLHFDTSHLNHIKWSNPEELKERLANQIRSTILPKA